MTANSQEIVVTDIKVPFLSMVVLLVKWALAAIPAMVILFTMGTLFSMLANTLLESVFGSRGTV